MQSRVIRGNAFRFAFEAPGGEKHCLIVCPKPVMEQYNCR